MGGSILIGRNYAYGKDSRDEAREWVEKFVPKGTNILIDMPHNCPRLQNTREQMERFLESAEKTNNYKKEFWKLKLETLDPGATTYNIYVVQREFHEIGSIPQQVKDVQVTQDLIPITGEKKDFATLDKFKIRCIITNDTALRAGGGAGDF